ncbi:hypothetical protein D6833_12485 [Candidatus Parcubacteria bacterium]|nr:MAG: hypothetical protein D6833_12485 [Candidatus Parcubacteria bacterium]
MGLLDFSLGDVGGLIRGIREAITGEKIKDPVELAKVQLQLEQLENALAQGQLEINKAEAQHPSIFVAGARPFLMWGCGFALLYASLFEPLMRFIAVVAFDYNGEFPVLDTTVTTQVLMGLLGLAGMRSYDKTKGIDTRRIGNAK